MEYGGAFDTRSNEPFLSQAPGFLEDDWLLFRSGRDAMRALARGLGPRKVLLPALCCESMIVPLRQNGCSVGFYRLREDLRADEADVLRKAAKGTLLIYLSYFGIRPFEDRFLERLRESGVLLAEDRTQDLVIRRAPGGFQPDAVFASLRKWGAVPGGGMLQTALAVESGPADSRFGDMQLELMEKKTRYLESGDQALKRDLLRQQKEAEALLDLDGPPAAMSEDHRRQLERLDLYAIGRVRQRNLHRLRKRLEPLHQAGKLRFLSENAEDSALYLPILLEDRERVKFDMWAQGIYHPVIWPEPEEAAGICPVSHHVVAHMLALLCDHRYSTDDMDELADRLIESINRQE